MLPSGSVTSPTEGLYSISSGEVFSLRETRGRWNIDTKETSAGEVGHSSSGHARVLQYLTAAALLSCLVCFLQRYS